MKPGIHPGYRPVVFRDASADFAFLTGRGRTIDTAGRVERFQQRHGRRV
jgi:large subunit ribosomal protein L31